MQTRKPPHMHTQRDEEPAGPVRGSAHLVREPLEAFSNAITRIPPRRHHLPRAVQRVKTERKLDVLPWCGVAVAVTVWEGSWLELAAMCNGGGG